VEEKNGRSGSIPWAKSVPLISPFHPECGDPRTFAFRLEDPAWFCSLVRPVGQSPEAYRQANRNKLFYLVLLSTNPKFIQKLRALLLPGYHCQGGPCRPRGSEDDPAAYYLGHKGRGLARKGPVSEARGRLCQDWVFLRCIEDFFLNTGFNDRTKVKDSILNRE